MKILITGASGMLGSAVKSFAATDGHTVFSPSHSELDLKNESATLSYIENLDLDAIIHCAARVGGISGNISNPIEFLNDNIRIDASLLGAASALEINNLVYMGSSCMYPKNLSHPMEESEILSGPLESTNEGYALAKLVGWKTVQLRSESLQWRTLVLSNLYGPNDHFELGRSHLLAAIIEKIESALSQKVDIVKMWGDGSARREFTYVEDVAEFTVKSLNNLKNFPHTLNVGAGTDYSVLDYYQMVAKAFNYTGRVESDLSMPVGVPRKLMNSAKAIKLGWDPKTDIKLGIEKTISWYKKSKFEINR
jgi:GDP-L-fucose synthase